MFEQSGPSEIAPRYCLIAEAGRPVSAMAVQMVVLAGGQLIANAPLYLRLMQAVVADSISLGCRRLSLGRTALEPKARLGAKPVPLCVWMRHRQPLMNLIVRPLLGAIPHDEPPQRNAFEETEQ